VLLDDTTRVVERVRAAGGRVEVEIYPEMIHVFQAFAHFLPEGQQAIERIGAFVKAHTAEPARR
jgi:epsilon-lactone hydrolase